MDYFKLSGLIQAAIGVIKEICELGDFSFEVEITKDDKLLHRELWYEKSKRMEDKSMTKQEEIVELAQLLAKIVIRERHLGCTIGKNTLNQIVEDEKFDASRILSWLKNGV